MKLLHVDSSILGANSVSRAVTEAVVDRLKRSEPGLETTYRDLSASPLPHLTLAQLPGDHPLSALAPMSDAIQHDRAASQARVARAQQSRPLVPDTRQHLAHFPAIFTEKLVSRKGHIRVPRSETYAFL
jgi:Flavodoxin-like fold